MKTKKAPAPTMTLAKGIGLDTTPSPTGYGLENEPAVVMAIHPIYGTRVHGPFVSIDAAVAWAASDGEEEIVSTFGSIRGWTLHPTTIEVPASYR